MKRLFRSPWLLCNVHVTIQMYLHVGRHWDSHTETHTERRCSETHLLFPPCLVVRWNTEIQIKCVIMLTKRAITDLWTVKVGGSKKVVRPAFKWASCHCDRSDGNMQIDNAKTPLLSTRSLWLFVKDNKTKKKTFNNLELKVIYQGCTYFQWNQMVEEHGS